MFKCDNNNKKGVGGGGGGEWGVREFDSTSVAVVGFKEIGLQDDFKNAMLMGD